MNNNDLFSDKNQARAGGKQASASSQGRTNWRNLLKAMCPKCGYRLVSGTAFANATSGRIMNDGTLLCENPHCSFAITAGKANSITAEMRAPKRDEETNQAFLNNDRK